MSKKDDTVYSAFVLMDDGMWEQPSFRVKGPRSEKAIERALLVATAFNAFIVFGLQEDNEAPKDSVRTLDTRKKRWTR